jgi:hypothetical protein
LSTGARARFGAAVVAAGLRAGDFFAGDLRAGVFPTACSAIFAFATRAGAFAFADVFFAALRASAGAAFTVLRTTVLRAAVFLTGLDDGVLGIAEMSVKKESIFYDAQKRDSMTRRNVDGRVSVALTPSLRGASATKQSSQQ